MDSDQTSSPKKPSLLMAILPIALTIFLLMLQLFVFDDFTPHIPLVLGIMIVGALGWWQGYRWSHMEAGLYKVVSVGLPSMAILMTVGMIIGVWILSGTVPLLIYYGLAILSPGIFLFATCLICAIISLATGTSWGTVGTVGLALIGIGEGLGIPLYLTAGAVVSGAFFGDKMSPLSDTTNLAPAVCGTDLWSHIRGMMATTGPAMLVALGLYAWIGTGYASDAALQSESVAQINATLQETFALSVWLLIPPIVVVALAVRRFPALPSIFTGVLLGGILAVVVQGVSVHEVFNAMQSGYTSDTGIEVVDRLLSKGGIQSMTWVITLVLIALGFGGMLERTRCLEVVLESILKIAKSRFGLVAASTGSAIGTNVVTGDVYLSVALPGRMFAPAYRGRGLSTTVLSRSIEDGGTLISPLIPWNVGGAFVAGTLGVETLAYAPVAFACWLSMLFGLLWAATGWFVPKASDEERQRWKDLGEAVMDETGRHDAGRPATANA
ncbi:Na+/H+ antiporter NhaC [Halomonas heilongjiangensis]|uniref:Na+/H+ antiporter NhaC n=1 Tax=Halomonas heilongjiangensis TaxID=1387883 RepID=A0A2N7TQT7_9GAMM|nr:Na+/H+ antiporter NhaC [Halomonas heilongjiangensis]PMR70468.1 Na+/H+ antiporter NhaC [Halomonas heilongjiangensis]PXX94595.1 Na+/H+ antiporter NhaC [Halomonas heilongjiangensis]